MQEENFIVREPLLNTQERVLGYELAWHASTSRKLGAGDANQLVQFVNEQIIENGDASLLGDHALFLAVTPALVRSGALAGLPKKSTVLAVRQADLKEEGVIAGLGLLHATGYSLSLREVSLAVIDKTLLPLFSYVETSVTATDFAAQVEAYRSLELVSPLRMIVRDVSNWGQYEQCMEQGLYAFVGKLHLMRRPGERSRDMNPAQAIILQLMDMVRKGDDIRLLENVLKRDAALSYKLLRYINSAGFSLGCEIHSLRHAVTLLGYSPLYRWLALLLTTSTTAGYPPVLMQAAVIRARFSELIGQGFLPMNEAENLFVAGLFSLLDRLFGIPMEDALEKIPLSDAVSQALLSREGIYGPFLALAEACELGSADIESRAASLCISANQVNQAQVSALSWAQNLAF